VSTLTTPSPYLRDRLLQAADGLRADAETARNRLDAANIDVAEARELLAEAETAQRRARAEVDGIAHGIARLEAEAAILTARIDADPAEKLAETGLMPVEPPPHTGGNAEDCPACDGRRDLPYPFLCPDAPSLSGSDEADDLTAPGVIDSRAQIARLTGGIPVVPPPTPSDLDPGVTMPDTGLAPAPLEPAPEVDGPRHASTDTGRLRAIAARVGLIHEQDGDTDG
jgi:hypothetical protein